MEQLIYNAIQQEKTEAIHNGRVIANLPKPQKAGTLTQCMTYASQKAEAIAKQAYAYFLKHPYSLVFDYEKHFKFG